MANQIGTLAEKSLHAGLKEWLMQPGDQVEVPVDGFFIDIVRGELLIEIQTRHFGAMKRKLKKLLPNHRVLLVHPIAQEKWIVREKPVLSKTETPALNTTETHALSTVETAVFEPISRRKSPKRGKPIDIFRELIRIPHLLTHPNLMIAVLLTQQEDILRDDGKGSWRRKKWSLADRRLLTVVAEHRFNQPADYLTLLPESLPQPFTTQDLAETAVITRNLAQRTVYTLSRAGIIEEAGKQGNFKLYTF